MTIPLSRRFEILQRDGFTCRFCGRRAAETELEVDHLHPRARGGSDEPSNLVTSCRGCNQGKSDRIVVLPAANPWTSLVGKFFHTFDADDGRIHGQGVILAEAAAGVFMVREFEWISGGPAFYGTRLVSVTEMTEARWSFYETEELMHDAFRYGGRAPRWPAEDERASDRSGVAESVGAPSTLSGE